MESCGRCYSFLRVWSLVGSPCSPCSPCSCGCPTLMHMEAAGTGPSGLFKKHNNMELGVGCVERAVRSGGGRNGGSWYVHCPLHMRVKFSRVEEILTQRITGERI